MVGVPMATFPISIEKIRKLKQVPLRTNFQMHMMLEPDYKNFKDKYETKEELLTNFTSQTTSLKQGPSI
jgi:hypothetical protein